MNLYFLSFRQEKENPGYFRKKEKLLEKWDEVRDSLIRTIIECFGMPQDYYCIICHGNPAIIRCNDCGTEQFFCNCCVEELHKSRNLFHFMGLWDVYA